MNIDIFRDLGLNNTVKSNTSQTGNIICVYKIDTISSDINKGDLVSFFKNKIKKATGDDSVNAIALSSGKAEDIIKCQITGIVKLQGLIAGAIYCNENGAISTNKTNKEIGKALNDKELLLVKGVFINV